MDKLVIIDELTFKVLVELLFNMVPEYHEYFEIENKNYDYSTGSYLFMNEFASYLCKEIERDPKSVFVEKAFVFINKIGESNNLEILNIIRVGILEILYSNKNTNREFVSHLLSKKLKKYFQEFSQFYI